MEGVEKWVQETFAPVVLTCSSPEVERLAQKNNLAFADLLNGFSMLKQTDTPLRSVNHSYTVTDFNFRFLAATQFAPLPLADSMRLLNEVVMRHPPTNNNANSNNNNAVIDLDMPSVRCVDDVPVFLRVLGAANNAEPLAWYREFKRALMDSFRCEEYSMMGQPAAMLVAVSSTESNPRASFEQLSAPQNLPNVFSQGLYDSNLPKFYLVVHDVAETEGTSIDAEAILRNLQIPTHSGAVLFVNSLALDAATDVNAAIWSNHPHVRTALFPDANSGNYPYLTDHVGGFLASDDLARVGSFVRDFGLRFVLPALETRIFQLNEVVSAMKKGVKNVFKSWLRKPKDLTIRTIQQQQNNSNNLSTSVTYRADSIEAQTRLLADTAFMVRDYDLALQMYRLVRDDYKSDKSLYHCANANEMIALCLLLTKGSPVQMTNALDAATSAYYKISNPATCRLAVRAAVMAGEIYVTLSHMGLFTDYMDNASAALIRGSTMEQGICSAVLMERAAMCDLQARSPKFRKFGFRMVMAGHVYDSLGHSAHSARCYALARAVYDSSGWFQVEDHINFTLAQQSNRLNDPMASIQLFLKLIGTGRNSASQQEALLYEFGMIVKEFLASGGTPANGSTTSRNGPVMIKTSATDAASKKLVVRDLCMPELDDKSTVVFAPVNAMGINREIDGNDTESDAWKELDYVLEKQALIHRQATAVATTSNPQGGAAPGNRWLAAIPSYNLPHRGKRGAAALLKPRQYALGEKIYVEFEMKNALSCAVDVENIHLYGKFEPSDPSTGGSGGDAFDVPESENVDGSDDSHQRIQVDRVNLQLLPVSEERVRLAVCPNVPGKLRITGVRWSICGGDVLGEHAFSIPGPLLQDTRANKEARARAPNVTLIADVVGHMPWLGVGIQSVVSETYVGEIVQLKVSLHNAGSADLGHLQLCCSDLSLCVAPDATSSSASTILATYIGANGQVVDLTHMTLCPGEHREIVLWARASKIGKQQSRLLFKYKRLVPGEDPERALSRGVQFKLDLHVLPCVNVAYSIEPNYASSGEYILALTVKNTKPQRSPQDTSSPSPAMVTLERLTCVSKAFRVEPFHSASLANSSVRKATLLDAQETSTCYFRVLPKANSDETSFVALSTDLHKDVDALPLDQMLCLDHALEMVRIADAATSAAAGNDGAGGGGGGGVRSIQSVRRENKALKGGAADSSSAENQAQADTRDPQPTSKDALLHSRDVDAHLILVWSSPKLSSTAASTTPSVVGQTNLVSVKIRSPLKSTSCPLTITLDYADSVSLRGVGNANGSQSQPNSGLAFAEVDVVMTVRNDSTLSARPIDFTLELLHPEESKPKTMAVASTNMMIPQQAPAPHFFWAGLTKKRVARFAPNAKTEFKLKACFLSAGVYDLNRFRFLVTPCAATDDGSSLSSSSSSSSSPAVFVFPVEYLIYVQPAAHELKQVL